VGISSKYLKDVPKSQRPRSIIFVDLDNDVLDLGFNEVSNSIVLLLWGISLNYAHFEYCRRKACPEHHPRCQIERHPSYAKSSPSSVAWYAGCVFEHCILVLLALKNFAFSYPTAR
jgi:hypothetical protein